MRREEQDRNGFISKRLASQTSTYYMRGDDEFPETRYSTDDNGGTLFTEVDQSLPISRFAKKVNLR